MSGRDRKAALAAAAAAALALAAAIVVLVVVNPGSSPNPGPRPALPAPVTTTSAGAAEQAPALPAPPGLQLGANVNLLLDPPGIPDATIQAQLHALHAVGATLARSDALWEASEPTAPVGGVHHYVWTFDDRVASLLAAAGLRWLPVIDYSPSWTQSIPGQDHSPPRSDADYAAYAAAVAARYGAGGAFWRAHPGLPALPAQTVEIWNEPDQGEFWAPKPDPDAYAVLYLTARSAIDTASPGTRVIIGGLTAPWQFLPELLAAQPQLAGHIDGVSVHPYGRPAVVMAKLAGARKALNAAHLSGVPLYVTEFGWTTSPPGSEDYAPATRRPGYILATLAELDSHACGLAAAVLYTWYSPAQDRADSQQWYGLSGPSDTGNPDILAFAAGLHRAASAPPPTLPCSS